MQTDTLLKIAVCDDEPADLKQITEPTGKILQDASIQYQITEYASAKALLADIQRGVQFQLLLLDVMMDEMDGIALAAELRRLENKAVIIFISINREMALQGYEVSAVRYLAKPVNPHKLQEALLYCCTILQEKKEILLPTEQGQCRISCADILYLEAFERGTRFILTNESVCSRAKFNEAEELLPHSAFLRCHRAYMVNLAGIKFIRPYEFVLKNGQCVPISRGRYAEVHKKLVDYLAD